MAFKNNIFKYFIILIIFENFSTTCFGKRMRIIGGTNTNIKEVPHQVSIRYIDGNKHFCGGSIITNQHVLTAAHCVKTLWPPYSNVKIYTGTSISNSITGNKYSILLVNMHPGYTGRNKTSFHNDIAVITIDGIIIFNGFQKKIDLPTKDVRVGDTAIISGWGFQTYAQNNFISVHLQKAFMKIVKKSDCTRSIGCIIHKEQICAFQNSGIGGCDGDSGGPLTSKGKLIGVISFVVPCATGVPDVFTNVYHYLDFINGIINS